MYHPIVNLMFVMQPGVFIWVCFIVKIGARTMMKSIFFQTLVLLAVCVPMVSYAGEHRLNIVYTGSIHGELEPCGCSPKTDFGGLARLSGYLTAHRDELSPYILIDAGNFTDKDTPQGKLKAEAVLKSYNIMKYDAVGLMKNEMNYSPEFLIPLTTEHEIPGLSESFPFKRSVSIDRGGFKIHISAYPEEGRKDGINILLTDRPVSEAGLIKGWDVIIVASGDIVEEPLKLDGTVLLAGYPRGKKTGMLTLAGTGGGGVVTAGHTWLSFGPDVREDAQVRAVITEYDAKVSGLLKSAEKPAAGDAYTGVSGCAACHQPYEESWKKTRHASAFDSLVHAGKAHDPECIVCHSVGFGEKGGFFTLETTPALANVQCEECHGQGREHAEDYTKPMKRVNETVCLKCHTGENSPDFDFPVYFKKIIH